MSKAKTEVKVLRQTLKRLQQGHIQGAFVRKPDALNNKASYCMIGAVTGGKSTISTPEQRLAAERIHTAMVELDFLTPPPRFNESAVFLVGDIMSTNDKRLSQSDAILVAKHALVAAECEED